MRAWLACVGAVLALGAVACGSSDGSGGASGPDATVDAASDPGSPDASFDWGASDPGAAEEAVPEPTVDTASDPGAPDAVEPDTADLSDVALAESEPGPEVVEPAPDVPALDTTPSVTPIGTFAVNCAVPYVLDASQASNTMYMVLHFGDLMQQYCITGVVGGVDVTQVAPGQEYPEKMYYGSHPPAGQGSYVSLMQASMTDSLQPVYSVRVDFDPDSAVKPGSTWGLGLDAGDAFAMLLHHTSLADYCVMAVGVGGSLTFSAASNVTAVEGGSFTVAGSMDMGDPHDVGLCGADGLPCCP